MSDRNAQCLKAVNGNSNDKQVVFIESHELNKSEFYLVRNTVEIQLLIKCSQ